MTLRYKSNFRAMKMVGGKQMKAVLGLSIEFKVPGEYTGTANSYQDSVDFDPQSKKVDSLHFVNSAKQPGSGGISSQVKLLHRKDRDIYKAALMSGLKEITTGEIDKSPESQSVSEGSLSDDNQGREDSPRKSRFGPKG